jgi:hypothetical protein
VNQKYINYIYYRIDRNKMNNIESLKEEIKYMRELGCNKLADLLVGDLEKLPAYQAKDYSYEAREAARKKYGVSL